MSAELNNSHDNLNNTIQSDDEVDGMSQGDLSLTGNASNSQPQKKRNARESDLLDGEVDDFFDSLPDIGKAKTSTKLVKGGGILCL